MACQERLESESFSPQSRESRDQHTTSSIRTSTFASDWIQTRVPIWATFGVGQVLVRGFPARGRAKALE